MDARQTVVGKYHLLAMIGLTIFLSACTGSYHNSGAPLNLGKPITEQQLAAWNIDVAPSGAGLPIGSGSAITGEPVYQQKCANCHGDKGQGGVANRLAGGGGLDTPKPSKTVGSFWPYSTTIFDYVRRAMPHHSPQSLSNNEVYGATAYILYLNKTISKEQILDASNLASIKMPNRDGFIYIGK